MSLLDAGLSQLAGQAVRREQVERGGEAAKKMPAALSPESEAWTIPARRERPSITTPQHHPTVHLKVHPTVVQRSGEHAT